MNSDLLNSAPLNNQSSGNFVRVYVAVAVNRVVNLVRRLFGLGGGLHRFAILDSSGKRYILSNINRTYTPEYTKVVIDGRVATGLLRRRHIANKRIFRFAWTMLPFKTTDVQDGGIGGKELKEIFDAAGTVKLYVPDGSDLSPGDKTYECLVSSDGFSREITFIGDKMYWNVSISLEEV